MIINNRNLRREITITDDIEEVRWFETNRTGHVLGDIPTYIEKEITNQDDLDDLEIKYELSLIKKMLPKAPVL